MFEGEGCIHIKTKEKGVCIQIQMTDGDVIKRFASIMDYGNVCGPHKEKNKRYKPYWKEYYRWSVVKKAEVIRILNLLLPFLGERRSEKANEALRSYENIS